MPGFIDDYLENVEFDNDIVSKWYPLGKEEPIVINPKICYGASIIDGSRITTDFVYGLPEVQTIDEISKYWEIPKEQINKAIIFYRLFVKEFIIFKTL